METGNLLSQNDFNNQIKKDTLMGKFAYKYTTPLLLAFDRYTLLNMNPNHISFLNSFFMTILGLVCIYYQYYFLTGFIIFSSMIIDGYDGVVARRLNKTSLSGTVFDTINDKFRDLIIGFIIYLTSEHEAIRLIGVLYGSMSIIPSYLRMLVFQNKIIYTRIYTFHYALRYVILFAAYTVLQFSNSLTWFGLLISINVVGLSFTFGLYYIKLYRITLQATA